MGSSTPRASFLLCLVLLAGDSATAATEPELIVSSPVSPGLSPALRDLPKAEIPRDLTPREINRRENPLADEPDGGRRGTWERESVPIDPLVLRGFDPTMRTPALGLGFDATGNPAGCGGCAPPDVVGDVGPNHYVHMVNATKVAVYDKAGNLIAGPTNLGLFWNSGNCQSNLGDPIPLYDPLAERWLLSQFASPSHMCIAISQTPDPTSSYFIYEFDVGSFPDYFKLGVWPDAYYMSANEGTYTAYAFDRAEMLAGQPATFQKFTGQDNLLLPADVDGSTPPPGGEPGLFYTFKDGGFHGVGGDRIELFEFDVDWQAPGNSTFQLVETVNVTPFTYTPCGFFNFNCLRQEGTSQRLDSVAEWPMHRFPYRNFGDHEVLLGTFVVGGGLGEEGAALRWFELRDEGSGWTLHQEGTYDPGDGHDRALPSIAMDAVGNIALGFTVTSSTIHPQIHYASRTPSDPLGTLGSEEVIIDGGGSQTGTDRWGDYAAMSIDPADDCTFFYTNEYYASSSSATWRTRVGAFAHANCGNSTIFSDGFEDGDAGAWN